MKLCDFLKDKDWEMIYVGASSGFFFIGSIEEFLRDSDDLSIEILKGIENRVNELYQRWKSVADESKKPEIYRTYQNNLEKMKNFRLLKNRTVKEYYPSIRCLNKNHMVIIVEGDEIGRYITRDEYIGVEKPWKPNKNKALDDNYKALAAEIVAKVGREYINNISFTPTTKREQETHEYRRERLEWWMRSKECGLLSPLSGQELIDTLKRNAGRLPEHFRNYNVKEDY